MQQILNNLYSDYIIGDLGRKKFEGLLYMHLINNQEKTCLCHWKSEDYTDFLSWFYPRMRRSIDSYKEIGSSFEAFIYKYLLVSSREYRVKKTTRAVVEYSAWSAMVPEMYAREEPPPYIHRTAEDIISQLIVDRNGRKDTKRILALILKCYYYISEDLAEKIAPLIGINKTLLIDMLSKMRNIRQKRDDDIYNLKERIYCQFYRCIIYDRKLSLLRENTSAYNKTKLQLEKARQRLEKMRCRMANIRIEATNRQIAEVIGTRKGTVDSSLYQLKTKWDVMAKKAELN